MVCHPLEGALLLWVCAACRVGCRSRFCGLERVLQAAFPACKRPSSIRVVFIGGGPEPAATAAGRIVVALSASRLPRVSPRPSCRRSPSASPLAIAVPSESDRTRKSPLALRFLHCLSSRSTPLVLCRHSLVGRFTAGGGSRMVQD